MMLVALVVGLSAMLAWFVFAQTPAAEPIPVRVTPRRRTRR